MALNFDVINESMGRQTSSKEQEVKNFAETMDPNDTLDLIKFQQIVGELGIQTNLHSATIKAVRDFATSVVQKI